MRTAAYGSPRVYLGDGKWRDYDDLFRVLTKGQKVSRHAFESLMRDVDRVVSYEFQYENRSDALDAMPGGAQGARPDMSDFCGDCRRKLDRCECSKENGHE